GKGQQNVHHPEFLGGKNSQSTAGTVISRVCIEEIDVEKHARADDSQAAQNNQKSPEGGLGINLVRQIKKDRKTDRQGHHQVGGQEVGVAHGGKHTVCGIGGGIPGHEIDAEILQHAV